MKASKVYIAAALEEYAKWRAMVDARLAKIDPNGAARIGEWADSVRERIAEGECIADYHVCTKAAIRSVVRAIEDFERGYYIGVTPTGGFHCARSA